MNPNVSRWSGQPQWQRKPQPPVVRTPASDPAAGFVGRRGVLETWTDGGDDAADARGQRYVGQRFIVVAAQARQIRQTQLVRVQGLFADGARVWMHLWDVALDGDEASGQGNDGRGIA